MDSSDDDDVDVGFGAYSGLKEIPNRERKSGVFIFMFRLEQL